MMQVTPHTFRQQAKASRNPWYLGGSIIPETKPVHKRNPLQVCFPQHSGPSKAPLLGPQASHQLAPANVHILQPLGSAICRPQTPITITSPRRAGRGQASTVRRASRTCTTWAQCALPATHTKVPWPEHLTFWCVVLALQRPREEKRPRLGALPPRLAPPALLAPSTHSTISPSPDALMPCVQEPLAMTRCCFPHQPNQPSEGT